MLYIVKFDLEIPEFIDQSKLHSPSEIFEVLYDGNDGTNQG